MSCMGGRMSFLPPFKDDACYKNAEYKQVSRKINSINLQKYTWQIKLNKYFSQTMYSTICTNLHINFQVGSHRTNDELPNLAITITPP